MQNKVENGAKTLAGKAWIQACQFKAHSNKEVIDHVLDRCQPGGVLLLDLDSTLYEVGPRTFQILEEFRNSEFIKPFEKVRETLSKMKAEQMGYSLYDTFTNIGLSPLEYKEALKVAKDFWRDRFFTHEYLKYDHVYPGAVEFVNNAYDKGVNIIYLTGRDEPGMGKGTRDRLVFDAFPFNKPRTKLFLKKDFHIDDLHHKMSACDEVRKEGALVASFENEPPNVVAFSEQFPDAAHIFMDSSYSDREAPIKHDLFKITSYL